MIIAKVIFGYFIFFLTVSSKTRFANKSILYLKKICNLLGI